MGNLPAEVRKKKVLPFCRLLFQSPDMESQVARCMALQFPNVLSQVGLPPLYLHHHWPPVCYFNDMQSSMLRTSRVCS